MKKMIDKDIQACNQGGEPSPKIFDFVAFITLPSLNRTWALQPQIVGPRSEPLYGSDPPRSPILPYVVPGISDYADW